MDVRLACVLLPPHPRLWIDADDGSGVNLAMPQHLTPHLELTPETCTRFQGGLLTPHSQTPGNAR